MNVPLFCNQIAAAKAARPFPEIRILPSLMLKRFPRPTPRLRQLSQASDELLADATGRAAPDTATGPVWDNGLTSSS